MQETVGKDLTVRELLKGVKYSIDYYQRDYKWQTKQIQELVDDLTGKFLEGYEPEHARATGGCSPSRPIPGRPSCGRPARSIEARQRPSVVPQRRRSVTRMVRTVPSRPSDTTPSRGRDRDHRRRISGAARRYAATWPSAR